MISHERSQRASWIQTPERGSLGLLRLMSGISLALGRNASRPLLYLIALYFFAFAPEARIASRTYLPRALKRRASARDRFRQLLHFSTCVHDRVYLLNNRFDRFEISVHGEELLKELLSARRGAFLMGAHLGSFEVMRSLGLRQPGLRVVMAMYEENARRINAVLAGLNAGQRAEIVPLGRIDSMIRVAQTLDEGAFVGVLADRTLGHEAALHVQFLEAGAHLPLGPMRAAAILRRRVVFMAGLYRGANRYHLVFEPLVDFANVSRTSRESLVRDGVERYAALLEKYCRSDPYNWFNFFDFWADPRRAR